MINNKLRDFIAEEHEESIIFNVPSYDNSIVGLVDNHIVYDFDLMVDEYMKEYATTATEAIEFIEYNTLRTLPYLDSDNRPIIMFDSKMIREFK